MLHANTLIEFLDAVADTKYIVGQPFQERGGVMLVGPPGSLKTTMIEAALNGHSDAITLSDLNVQQWLKMKDEFITKRYTCLGFGEFEKIYQRHPATASNLEGIIKALVSEGFKTGPGGDPRMPAIKARACVIGGITTDCLERHYSDWQKNGFLRRFLWFTIAVKDPELIMASIRKWERINLGTISYRPAETNIDVHLSEEISKTIESCMREQPGLHGTGYVLAKKVCAVLEWKYSAGAKNGKSKTARNRAVAVIEQLAKAMSTDGDELIFS